MAGSPACPTSAACSRSVSASCAPSLAEPIGCLAHRPLGLPAPRLELRQRRLNLAHPGLALGERHGGGVEPCRGEGLRRLRARRVGGELVGLGAEPPEHCVGILDHCLFAIDVGVALRDAAVELGETVRGTALLMVERVLGMAEALQGGRSRHFGVAERWQLVRRDGREASRLGLCARALGDEADIAVDAAFGLDHLAPGLLEGEVEEDGFGPADLRRQRPVALRLARLAPEPVELALDLAEHVLQPLEVLLGAAQAQLGLVPARMQARKCRQLPRGRAGGPAAWPRSARRSGPAAPWRASARRSRRRRR